MASSETATETSLVELEVNLQAVIRLQHKLHPAKAR